MYLSHFGLSEQPFAHIPVTNFFYDGANRGATLDALIYVLTHGEGVEGIIKVTGEAGSGKTTLCRLLMKRLPPQMKTIYLAKPDLSRDELLHSLADELKSELTVSRTPVACATVTISDLENALIEKYAIGGQVILLIDEAHAIAAETLEELRLLYDLESARHKLLQIVLFGQTELEATLALPKMRQFKNRVTHHFAMQPFNAKAANDYLKLRMHAAGYRGPDIFSSEAVRLITMASGGLTQRINILADKSLLAAFNVNTHEIDVHGVKAVIKDSGIKSDSHLAGLVIFSEPPHSRCDWCTCCHSVGRAGLASPALCTNERYISCCFGANGNDNISSGLGSCLPPGGCNGCCSQCSRSSFGVCI